MCELVSARHIRFHCDNRYTYNITHIPGLVKRNLQLLVLLSVYFLHIVPNPAHDPDFGSENRLALSVHYGRSKLS